MPLSNDLALSATITTPSFILTETRTVISELFARVRRSADPRRDRAARERGIGIVIPPHNLLIGKCLGPSFGAAGFYGVAGSEHIDLK